MSNEKTYTYIVHNKRDPNDIFNVWTKANSEQEAEEYVRREFPYVTDITLVRIDFN